MDVMVKKRRGAGRVKNGMKRPEKVERKREREREREGLIQQHGRGE